jgi:hypothetical protein
MYACRWKPVEPGLVRALTLQWPDTRNNPNSDWRGGLLSGFSRYGPGTDGPNVAKRMEGVARAAGHSSGWFGVAGSAMLSRLVIPAPLACHRRTREHARTPEQASKYTVGLQNNLSSIPNPFTRIHRGGPRAPPIALFRAFKMPPPPPPPRWTITTSRGRHQDPIPPHPPNFPTTQPPNLPTTQPPNHHL